MDYSYIENEMGGSVTVKTELEPDNFIITDDENVNLTCQTPIEIE